MNKKLTKTLQSYCDRLNKCLPCKTQEDVDNLYAIMNECINSIEGSMLYWSREIYIDSGFDFEKCGEILVYRECMFVPVNDIEEHIGIKVIYKYEQE